MLVLTLLAGAVLISLGFWMGAKATEIRLSMAERLMQLTLAERQTAERLGSLADSTAVVVKAVTSLDATQFKLDQTVYQLYQAFIQDGLVRQMAKGQEQTGETPLVPPLRRSTRERELHT